MPPHCRMMSAPSGWPTRKAICWRSNAMKLGWCGKDRRKVCRSSIAATARLKPSWAAWSSPRRCTPTAAVHRQSMRAGTRTLGGDDDEHGSYTAEGLAAATQGVHGAARNAGDPHLAAHPTITNRAASASTVRIAVGGASGHGVTRPDCRARPNRTATVRSCQSGRPAR